MSFVACQRRGERGSTPFKLNARGAEGSAVDEDGFDDRWKLCSDIYDRGSDANVEQDRIDGRRWSACRASGDG